MKVIVTHTMEDFGMFESLDIVIDETTKFRVYHSDSPEDNNLSRNFADCHDIPELLMKAFEAGKRGEEFEIEYIHEGDSY